MLVIASGPAQVNVQVRGPAGKATIPGLAVNVAPETLGEVCNFFVSTLSVQNVSFALS